MITETLQRSQHRPISGQVHASRSEGSQGPKRDPEHRMVRDPPGPRRQHFRLVPSLRQNVDKTRVQSYSLFFLHNVAERLECFQFAIATAALLGVLGVLMLYA